MGSAYDSILAKYSGEPSGSTRPPSTDGSRYDAIVDRYASAPATETPGIASRAVHAVGSVLGAPKSLIDAAARAGARAQGMNVPDDMTTGRMMRQAAGLTPEQGDGTQGYGGAVGGKALEFATDLATDPVTWAMGGVPKALGGAALARTGASIAEALPGALGRAAAAELPAAVRKGAGLAFTGLMSTGALQEGAQAVESFRREGFSPRTAEEALGTALSAGGAGLGLMHMAGGRRAPRPEIADAAAALEASRRTSGSVEDVPPTGMSGTPWGFPIEATPPMATVRGPIEAPPSSLDTQAPEVRPVEETGGLRLVRPPEEVQQSLPLGKVPVVRLDRSRVQELVDSGVSPKVAKDQALVEAEQAPVEAVQNAPITPEAQSAPLAEPVSAPDKPTEPVNVDVPPTGSVLFEAWKAESDPVKAAKLLEDYIVQSRIGREGEPLSPAEGMSDGQVMAELKRNGIPSKYARQALDMVSKAHGIETAKERLARIKAGADAIKAAQPKPTETPEVMLERMASEGRPDAEILKTVKMPFWRIRQALNMRRAAADDPAFASVEAPVSEESARNRATADQGMLDKLIEERKAANVARTQAEVPSVEPSDGGGGAAPAAAPMAPPRHYGASPRTGGLFPEPWQLSDVETLAAPDPVAEIRARYAALREHVRTSKTTLEADRPAALRRLGFQEAADVRDATGDLTPREASRAATREERVNPGDAVDVTGHGRGTVRTLPFGKVQVEFEDGTRITLDRDEVTKVTKKRTPAPALALDPVQEAPVEAVKPEPTQEPLPPTETATPVESERFATQPREVPSPESERVLQATGRDSLTPEDRVKAEEAAQSTQRLDRTLSRDRFAAGEEQPAKPITREHVETSMPGLEFESKPDGSFEAKLKDGRTLRVSPVAAIEVSPASRQRLAESAAASGIEGEVEPVARYSRDDVARIAKIELKQGAPDSTAPHEFFHLMMDLALNEKEKAAVLEKYGDEEKAAYAYQDWTPTKSVNSWFSKIVSYARRMYRTFKPTWESTFEDVRAGRASERIREGSAGNTERFATAATAPTVPRDISAPEAPKKPGLGDQLLEGWTAGLVSGPPTQVANIGGNTGEMAARSGETVAGGIADRLISRLTGTERTRHDGEVRAELASAYRRAPQAFDRFAQSVKDAFALTPETEGEVAVHRGEGRSEGAIPGKFGRGVRIPFRLLEAADGFFKDVGGDAELGKLAFRQASNELQRGSKAAIRARADEIFTEASDSTGRHAKLREQVDQSRLERTYQDDPGKMVNSLIKLRSDHPWMRAVIPFVRVPANVARLTIQRTPVGFFKAFSKYKEYKAALAGDSTPENLTKLRSDAVDALARPLFGMSVMAGFGMAAQAGAMTGGGPIDDRQKNLLKGTGWQPYSFVVNVDGKKTYIPFNRFEPVSSLLGFVGDMAEAGDSKNAGDIFEKALGSIGQNLTNKTYLQGLSDAASFLARPKEFAKQYVSNMAGTVVPNIVASAARGIDPVVRDTSSTPGLGGIPSKIGKVITSRIPGASMTLPEKISGTGEVVEKPGNALTRALLPSQPSQERPDRELEGFLSKIGFAPSEPSRNVRMPTKPGQPPEKANLTDEEYGVMVEARRKASDRLRRSLDSPGFQRLTPEDQIKYVRKTYEDAGDLARERIMPRVVRRVRSEASP